MSLSAYRRPTASLCVLSAQQGFAAEAAAQLRRIAMESEPWIWQLLRFHIAVAAVSQACSLVLHSVGVARLLHTRASQGDKRLLLNSQQTADTALPRD